MIIYGQEEHLGRKALLLMLGKNTGPASVVLIVVIIITALQSYINEGLIRLAILAGQNGGAVSGPITQALNWLLLILYSLTIILYLIGFIITKLKYSNYSFTLEEFGLRLKKGILNISEITIPYRQIQDVNVERSLAYRMLGVTRLVIDSAGHESTTEHNETDIILEPIDEDVAEEIRQMLQRKIGVQVVEGEREADMEMSDARKESLEDSKI